MAQASTTTEAATMRAPSLSDDQLREILALTKDSDSVVVFKLKAVPNGLPRKMVVELWNHPDGSRLLELSTKCAPPEMFDVLAHTRAFLVERGVPIGGEQETKTRKALDYFSASLQAKDEGATPR